jgi:urease gamma subunit
MEFPTENTVNFHVFITTNTENYDRLERDIRLTYAETCAMIMFQMEHQHRGGKHIQIMV